MESGEVPGSTLSQTAKTAARMTPIAYSGIDVMVMEVTESARSSQLPGRHAGEHADEDGERHDDGEGDAGEHGGVAEAVPQDVIDGDAEEGGVAEVAEVTTAVGFVDAEAELGVVQRIGADAEQHAEPAAVADQQGIVQLQFLVEEIDLLLEGVGAEGFSGDVAGGELGDGEDEEGGGDEGEEEGGDAVDEETQHRRGVRG